VALLVFLFVVGLLIALAVVVAKDKQAPPAPTMEFRALPPVAPPSPGMLHEIPPPPAGANGAAGGWRAGPKWPTPTAATGAQAGNFVAEGQVQQSGDALCYLTTMKVSDCTCLEHVAQRKKNL
jgi:hypothetical protein